MLPTTAATTTGTKQRTTDERDAASAFGGGRAGFVAFAVWLALAFCGLVVFLAGLAALQNYMYQKGDEAGRIQAGAGLARLSAGNSLRWDWWALFWAVAACTLPALALASGGAVVSQARLALVAWLSIATVVVFISTNRLYDIMGWTAGKHKSAARAAYAGTIIFDIAALAAIYHLGLAPDHAA